MDLMANELAAQIGKRFASVSVAIQRSSLSRELQELVMLRASQINGCGWCVDLWTAPAMLEARVVGSQPVWAVVPRDRWNASSYSRGGMFPQ
ncbi:carboxymuconolactone decarboxylase family protein [Actinomadura sp. KC345]|uniref:carboxymuconolactone decarboxylase family protein n=1 Tax=Actinomadura sp. KC345 TaxID=2530371 RepID=UPI001A9F69F3|nr:carboxymuconolactone decarboxylase family protein [Actinomadura sp. KC345]